jgi:U3 small nucleolar RNA-associated protein 22
MDSIQVFTVWMKFISDLTWLGEEMSDSNDKSEDVDHIRFSSSQQHRQINFSETKGTLSRAAIVMPDSNKTEKQTVLSCVQSRLYAFDCKAAGAKESEQTASAKTLLDCFKLSCEGPVFLDPTMTVNYFGHLSPSFMRELQSEAKLALKCINFNGESSKSFKELFLERLRFWRRYDSYVTIDLEHISFPTLKNKSSRLFWGSDVQDLGGYESLSRGLIRVLNMALGNRVTALRPLTTGNGECVSPNRNSLKSATDDFGTLPILDSDENIAIPSRGTEEVAHYDYLNPMLRSPVTRHSNNKKMTMVIGLRLNPEHCTRIVDRGPPADDIRSTSTFLSLWGKEIAQLRRFKDGAIVHAAVWNDHDTDNVQYEGGEKTGGIVERMVAHIVKVHFYVPKCSLPRFALRNVVSLVEGVAHKNTSMKNQITQSSEVAYKDVVSAFEALSKFLTRNTSGASDGTSKLDLPLAIDSIEALSPFLRSSGLFPPLPHHLLGGHKGNADKKVAGVIMGDSILVQIRFEGSSKWPSDINAMGAAKCAMLIQLAEGLEKMKEQESESDCYDFGGPVNVTPSYVELGFRGYSWRIIVHADQELKMLSELRNPSQEAIHLGRVLRKRHVISASHHYTIHGVHTKYPASAYVVRLLQRWVAAHMLSGLIPLEAIELIVAYIFTDSSALHAPMTASCGLLRSLFFLASHDWSR